MSVISTFFHHTEPEPGLARIEEARRLHDPTRYDNHDIDAAYKRHEISLDMAGRLISEQVRAAELAARLGSQAIAPEAHIQN